MIPSFLSTLALSSLLLPTLAFDADSKQNVAVYWGQSSAGSQESLADYCKSSDADIFLLAFLSSFPDMDMNLSSACSGMGECSSVAEDIKTCQDEGKIVLLSMGGAVGQYGFTSDDEAEEFAQTLWDTFGGGSGSDRPFGDSVVDGFDFDIENNNPSGYAALAKSLRSKFDGASKQFYLSAAPQCPYPDASVGNLLDEADIDFAFIQFYNNYCSISGQFNWDTWTQYAQDTSPNKNIKLFLGLPGSSTAAGSGYVSDVSTLQSTISSISSSSNFGGVALWDASQAFSNEVDGETYIAQVKNALESASSSSDSSGTSSSSSIAATSSTVSSSTVSSSTVSSFTVLSSSSITSSSISSTTSASSSSLSSSFAPSSSSTPLSSVIPSSSATPSSTVASSSLESSASSSAIAPSSTVASSSSGTTSSSPGSSSTSLSSFAESSSGPSFLSATTLSSAVTLSSETSSSLIAPSSTKTSFSAITSGSETLSLSNAVSSSSSSSFSTALTTEGSWSSSVPSYASLTEAPSSNFLSSSAPLSASTPSPTPASDSTLASTLQTLTSGPSISSRSATTLTPSSSASSNGAHASAVSLNDKYAAGMTNEASCTSGDIACSGSGSIAICDQGSWVVMSCAAGTTCYAYDYNDTVFTGCNFISLKQNYLS
ncbi:CTS1 (YLR286C) [Zygosaccharomyces parabailii]|nr:CTS1 (YLR286C) [Zygosaccharomyces parabailii]